MKYKLISINISNFQYIEFVNRILSLGLVKSSSYVCVANVHMLIEAYRDPEFAEVVNDANLITPDGMPLAKGIELLYGHKQERAAGMDLLPDLIMGCQKQGISVFFYGGTQKMIDKTAAFCVENYPFLKVAGLISPPFRQLSVEEENGYIEQINSSGAGFVFVALGCPKQEKWMASMKGRINACMIGIGGALPVMVGIQKRAPQWMQNSGLEWGFRLIQEPRRLFGRYFKTNTIFIYLFIKEFIKFRILKKV